MAGEIDAATLLQAAETGDSLTVQGQTCEAYYHLGMLCLAKHEQTAARDYFQKCVGTGKQTYDEYQLARAELARLAQPDGTATTK